MQFGNFLIGKDNLSITGYLTYIGYDLGIEGVEVLSRAKIAYNHENGTFLVCLKGDNLEEKIKKAIEEGKKRCSQHIMVYGFDSNFNSAVGPQIDYYRIISVYEKEEDAKNSFLVFSSKPHKELIKHVENIVKENNSELKEKGITIKDIDDLEDSDLNS